MSDLFWVLMPLIMMVYLLGVRLGRVGYSLEPKNDVSKAKHWHVCTDCVPGVTYKIGADTRDHLAQVIQWHEDDHHTEEETECLDTAHRGISLYKWPALRRRLRSSIYGEAAGKLWHEKVKLPPYRSADLPVSHGSIADISGPAPTALQRRVANAAMGLTILRR